MAIKIRKKITLLLDEIISQSAINLLHRFLNSFSWFHLVYIRHKTWLSVLQKAMFIIYINYDWQLNSVHDVGNNLTAVDAISSFDINE